jgi:hypothetical protein
VRVKTNRLKALTVMQCHTWPFTKHAACYAWRASRNDATCRVRTPNNIAQHHDAAISPYNIHTCIQCLNQAGRTANQTPNPTIHVFLCAAAGANAELLSSRCEQGCPLPVVMKDGSSHNQGPTVASTSAETPDKAQHDMLAEHCTCWQSTCWQSTCLQSTRLQSTCLQSTT